MLIWVIVQQRNDSSAWWADAISIWVGLSLSRIGKRTDRAWRRWHALDKNQHTFPNIAVSETRFLGAALKFLQGLSLEMWLQGTTWHSPAPCHLSLLRDKVSEHTGCLSISILLDTHTHTKSSLNGSDGHYTNFQTNNQRLPKTHQPRGRVDSEKIESLRLNFFGLSHSLAI